MEGVDTLIREVFSKKKPTPIPKLQESVPAPKKKDVVRTVGNPNLAAEAQRIYNPNLPPTKPKAPTKALLEQGTTAVADVTGSWGTPEAANG